MTLYVYDIIVNNKLHIKHMLIFKRAAKRKNVIDIAMLLDNNQYIEYSMAFKQNVLTFWVAKRITQLFSKYVIDNKTDIMVNGLIDVKHPVHIFISLLHANINFKFRTTLDLDQMISRIYYYFTSRSGSKRKFTVVWKTIIDKQACPWITKQVDYALQNKGPKLQYVMKTMRLGMFYMVIKNYLYNRTKKHMLKKKMQKQASSNV